MADTATQPMTNAQFGRRIGVTHSMASRIRSGARLPSIDVMDAIGREFGISWDALLNARRRGNQAFSALIRKRVFREIV